MHMEMEGERVRQNEVSEVKRHVLSLMPSAASSNEQPNDTLLKGTSTEKKKTKANARFPQTGLI